MPQLILTPEQFAFMEKHHEMIERSMVSDLTGEPDHIPTLEALLEYQALFGDMLWDEVYDRYEETPGYDGQLKARLKAQSATSSARLQSARSETSDLTDVAALRALRDAAHHDPIQK